MLKKGDFDHAQQIIVELRKSGELPIDICAEDSARVWQEVENVDCDDEEDEAARIRQTVDGWIDNWTPVSFWDDKKHFLVCMVEKIDLVSLFRDVCKKYRIPICNCRGWSDLNSRGRFIQMIQPHIQAGRNIVLLYCGDFDPAGLAISATLSQNILELNNAYYARGDVDTLCIQPWDFEIDRFGLNYELIKELNLTWIDNLETGSGKALNDPGHGHFTYPYVQNYIRDYCDGYLATVRPYKKHRGEYYLTDTPRKVEANTLVTQPRVAAELIEESILKYLGSPDVVDKYEAMLEERRPALRDTFYNGEGG